jgi:cytochrome c oxidase cbb3-type subunit 4
MYKQFYEGMALTELPLFALVLFIAVFFGVCAWVFGARRNQDFDTLAQLPLAERGEQGHE